MFLATSLKEPTCQPIKELYETWYKFMNENVAFSLADSEWHTKEHSARVLLLALLIGLQKGLRDEELETLGLTAVFHDTRRLNDGLDIGHGSRAADYYKEYCQERNLHFSRQVYYIIYYHDQDDSIGLAEFSKRLKLNGRDSLLYQIFKDADALDRFRLGPNALDEKYLRTKEASQLVNFSKKLFENS